MITGITFLCLAAAGAVGRGVIGHHLNAHEGVPFGTLLVNITGSFALGLLHETGAPAHTVFGVGMLGAYTTFSSFARDGVALVEQRRPALAVAYVLASVGGAVLAAAVGVSLA